MSVPALRFKNEAGQDFPNWKDSTLGEVAEIKRGAASQHLKYVEDKIHGIRLIRINDFLKNEPVYVEATQDIKRFTLQRNDLLIAGTGATAGIVFRVPDKFENLAYSYNAPRIRVNQANDGFIYYYLISDVVLKQQQGLFVGNAQPFLDTDAIRGFQIGLPSLPEQTKIANFLTAVDEKITQLTQKHDLLTHYKNGVMQQIFSQELRFKDDDGGSFPDWEEVPLENVLDYEQPTKYLVSSTEYSDSFKTPVLTAGKTFILGYTDETDGICEEGLPVIIFDDFTTAFKFVPFPFKAKSSAMKLLRKKADVNIYYVYSAMQLIDFPSGDEHKRYWISEYSKVIIPLPCEKEQTKIANFLTAIDNKITATQTQIQAIKQYKQGLLQQMFV